MKCIHCDNDCKAKERPDGRCPKCHHEFAFDPQKGDSITDMNFHRAIDRISSAGKVKWTRSHLWYELNRPKRILRSNAWILKLFLFLAFASFTAIAIASEAYFILIGLAVLSAIIFAAFKKVTLARVDFERLFDRWVKVHGKPAHLIPPAAHRALPSPALEAELEAYSFDRAVICDNRAIVDTLIANQFHFENNCAVLGVDGYPEAAFNIVMKMLRQNPRLIVFSLHDASVEGCRLAEKLRSSPEWFKGGAKVVDVGLRPAQTVNFKGLETNHASVVKVSAAGGISPKEVPWLEEHYLELTAVRPERLIKHLYNVIVDVEKAAQGPSLVGAVAGHAALVSSSAWASDTAVVTPYENESDAELKRREAEKARNDSWSGSSAGPDFTTDLELSDGGGDSFG